MRKRSLTHNLALAVVLVAQAGWTGVSASAATVSTQLVSVSTAAQQANGNSTPEVDVSDNGRYVVFSSDASNLVTGDTNAQRDIFLRDRQEGTTVRINVGPGGVQANGGSGSPAISSDGGRVVFRSFATNLVTGDTNGSDDVFLWERASGSLARVSVTGTGGQANGASVEPAVSPDGNWVAFRSSASNLVTGDFNARADIFLYSVASKSTARVSVTSLGAEANGPSYRPAVTANGAAVVFESMATNLVTGDSNRAKDVFVRDVRRGTTERLSGRSTLGKETGQYLDSGGASISSDGRYVAFVSEATNLTKTDLNKSADVFRYDRQATTYPIQLVSQASGKPGTAASGYSPVCAISKNGRYVAFASTAADLAAGDTNGTSDVYLCDFEAAGGPAIRRVSLTTAGGQANGASSGPAVSDTGSVIAFWSQATNLVTGDKNGKDDVFVRGPGVPGKPVAGDDRYEVERDGTLAVLPPGVLHNDTSPSETALSAQLVSGTTHGTLSLASNGSFTYQPNSGYLGTDSFTYTAKDTIGTSAPATVIIDVTNKIKPEIVLSSQSGITAYGATYSIVGTATAGGSPLAGKTVVLSQATPTGAFGFNTAITAVTAADGSFTLSAKQLNKMRYRAAIRGDAELIEAFSPIVTVTPRVSLPAPTAKRASKLKYKVSGTLRPDHKKGYSVRLYYRPSNSTRSKYITVKTTDKGSYSAYSATIKFPKKGKYVVWAQTTADSLHAATTGSKRTVSVK